MVLAGVLLKLGGYGFIRFSFFVKGFLHLYVGYFLSIGLLGGLARCFLCLRQGDLKAFVAYSSVCHIGFCLGGIYCSSNVGLAGGVYMLIAHGFCSSCLFYILYIFYERHHTRSLFLLKGLRMTFPSVTLVWFLFSVLNMGVPPSFSFFSEVFLVVGIRRLNIFSIIFMRLFLFLAGVYGIFFYVVSCHGAFIMDGKRASVSLREYLNCYGHLFPLLTVSFYLGVFY